MDGWECKGVAVVYTSIIIIVINMLMFLFLSRVFVFIRGKSVRSWCDGSSDRSFIELFIVPASAPRLVYVVCVILSKG